MKHFTYSLANLAMAAMMLLFAGCQKNGLDPNKEKPQEPDFTFKTLELTQGSFGVEINPKAADQTYFFNIMSKDEFGMYKSPEILQQNDVAKIKAIASQQGVSLDEFLMEALLKGTQTWLYTTLSPNTEYVFYTYGLSTECEIMTSLCQMEFKTPVVKKENVKFDINVTDVTATTFTLNIKPDRDDCSYYYDILLPAAYDSYCNNDPENVPAFAQAYLAEWKQTEKYAKYSMANFIDEVTVRGAHSDNTFANLLPEATYYAFAVCVANDGTIMSDATVVPVMTGESPKNEYTVTNEVVSDVSYAATVSASQSEAFAVMFELQEYFADAKSDAEIITELYNAHKQNISKYMYADAASVRFSNLIPNDNYYLLIFACNPDGTPELTEGKVNLKKVPVKTKPATMSPAKYSLSLSNATKTTVDITVKAGAEYNSETFLFNYITMDEVNAYQGDPTEGLKAHMNKFIDDKVAEWNNTHSGSGVMTRKEYLSRALMNVKEDAYMKYTIEGLKPGTDYMFYVFGLKADGTFTTAPVTATIKTLADKLSLAKIRFDVTAYTMADKKQDLYYIWPYASNSPNYYVKTFIGNDEWAGKKAGELVELLKKTEYPNQWQYMLTVPFGTTWYAYSVALDKSGIPTKVYKLQRTCPQDTGEQATYSAVKVDIVEVAE